MSRRHHALDPGRWAAVRLVVFHRDGYRCRSCHKSGRLECDHVTPLVDRPDQDAYDPENLQTLCRGCHITKTRRERAERERRRPVAPAVAEWRRLVAATIEGTP